MNDNSEIETLIRLRYGEVSFTKEWLSTLPPEVIKAAYTKISGYESKTAAGIDFRIQIMSILLRQPANKEHTKKAITEALIEHYVQGNGEEWTNTEQK